MRFFFFFFFLHCQPCLSLFKRDGALITPRVTNVGNSFLYPPTPCLSHEQPRSLVYGENCTDISRMWISAWQPLRCCYFLQPFNRCKRMKELSSEKSEPTRITLIKSDACFCSFSSINLFPVSPWLSLARCKRECFTPELLLMTGCDRVGGGA